ncbi:MAG: hypothetical protein PHF60_01920 [Candidatus ainarchaeum sp.]|nr:hypothetical protein [Candidatus ainarchaeum sp.]
MTGAIARRIERADVPALAMVKGFKGYRPETEKTVRKVEVVENETLKKLKNAYRKLEYGGERLHEDNKNCYAAAMSFVKQLTYSAAEVENFSVALAEFQNDEDFDGKAGLLLSALINNGDDADYVIHTTHLSIAPDSLGYENTKNIIVKGNAGYLLGQGMKGGSIIVEGDTEARLGEFMQDGAIIVEGDVDGDVGHGMKGGQITVKGHVSGSIGWWMAGGIITIKGNAGDNVGYSMKSGAIIVGGDANDSIGERMTGGAITVGGRAGDQIGKQMLGGEIHLEGDYASIPKGIKLGKIFHKEELIYDGTTALKRIAGWIRKVLEWD